MAPGSDLAAGLAPFVLTLELDGESFSRFNELRRTHYAPERNLVPAHVTLFHRLPGDHSREIKALLVDIAAKRKRFAISAGEVKMLERGVAVFLYAPQLQALREELAAEWRPFLTDEDCHGFRPHVTIANNIFPGEAQRIRQGIAASSLPRRIEAVGLHLWRYRDGPWEHEQLFRFR